jgi:hypothetical protein
MAVRVQLMLVALVVLYSCGQASSPAEKQEKQGGVEEAVGEKEETPAPKSATISWPAPDIEAATAAPNSERPFVGIVGQSVAGSSFDFRVLDYFVTNHYYYPVHTFTDQPQDVSSRAGKFIVVHYSVINQTSPETILPHLDPVLTVKTGNGRLAIEHSDAAYHPSMGYGNMEVAPRHFEVGQFIFDVLQDAQPKLLTVYDLGTPESASASASASASYESPAPQDYDIGAIDLTKGEPQGPQPQEILALQYEYYNMTAWAQAYELFAQETKSRVSEQAFVSKSQQDHQQDPMAFTEYSIPTVKIQGDHATMQVVRSNARAEGEGQERFTQEAVLEDEGWRIVMRDEEYKRF